MDPLLIALALVFGYLLGSISFAVIVARAHGVDILAVGSKNPGATNVKRSVSSRAGNLCFVLDFLKGTVATGWPLLPWFGFEDAIWMAVAGLAGAILGHSFSLFLEFRGGKGVAVSMGGMLALMPVPVLLGIVVWLVVFYAFRYVSLASLFFGANLPLSAWFLYGPTLLTWLALAIAVLIIARHHANIRRLLSGTEHKWERKARS